MTFKLKHHKTKAELRKHLKAIGAHRMPCPTLTGILGACHCFDDDDHAIERGSRGDFNELNDLIG